jgi:hypothetical protein
MLDSILEAACRVKQRLNEPLKGLYNTSIKHGCYSISRTATTANGP